jgi:N utilization substance protein B
MSAAQNSTGRRAVSRSAARLGAVQALYQMELAGTDVSEILAEYAASRQGDAFEDGQHGKADTAFMQDIIRGVVHDQRRIDRSLAGCLSEGWTLPRLDATLRAILRSGGFELLTRPDVPAKVVISEYVDLARAFFDGAEPKFINAALDKLAREIRSDEFSDQSSSK